MNSLALCRVRMDRRDFSNPVFDLAAQAPNRSQRNALLTFFDDSLGTNAPPRRAARHLQSNSGGSLGLCLRLRRVRCRFERLLPKEGDHGGAVYFEWDYSNQNTNWSGRRKPRPRTTARRTFSRTGWSLAAIPWSAAIGASTYGCPTANRSLLNDNNFPKTPAPTDIQKYTRRLHRRHRTHGHVHGLLGRYVKGDNLRREVADRRYGAPPVLTGTRRSERAAPISSLAAFGGA